MHRKGRNVGLRQVGSRHEHLKSVEKALIMALYFAVFASGGIALLAQAFTT